MADPEISIALSRRPVRLALLVALAVLTVLPVVANTRPRFLRLGKSAETEATSVAGKSSTNVIAMNSAMIL